MSVQDLSASAASAGNGASPPLQTKWTVALPLVMQAQLQDEWCWAATSSSISHFYDGSSAFSQCSIVNNLLGQRGCCTNGSSAECDKPWYLNRALTLTGNLSSAQQTFIAMAALQAELAAGHVVGAFIAWRGGGGHFLALPAVDVPASRVLVADPLNGTSDYDLAVFTNNYRGTGAWDGTYLTNAPAGVMRLGGGPSAAIVRETFDESAMLLAEIGPELAVGTRLSAERAATYRVFVFGLDIAVSGNTLATSTFAGYMTVVDSGSPSIIEVNLDALGNPTPPHHTRGRFVHSIVTQAIGMADARTDAELQKVSNGPWLTLYSHSSQQATMACFSTTLASIDPDATLILKCMGFGLTKYDNTTQVLFFKWRSQKAVLTDLQATFSVDRATSAAVKDAVAAKIAAYESDYIKSIDL